MKYLLCIFFAFSFLLCTSQNIKVFNERKLNLGLDTKVLVENQLSVNPSDPNHLLIAGMYVDSTKTSPDSYGGFSSISKNRGKTWSKAHVFKSEAAADPWGIITKKGTALFSHLEPNDLSVYRSEDGGKKWSEDIEQFGRYHDHQTIVQDENKSILYMISIHSSRITVNYSFNDGKDFFTDAFKFSNLSTNTLTPVLLSDGTLLISYSTFIRRAIGGTADAGTGEWLENSLEWLVSYTIRGGFNTPMLISEKCGKGFPVLTIDKSKTESKDNLYFVCSGSENNKVFSHYSNTKGKSWSSAIEVAKHHNFPREKRAPFTGMPQITVNNKGVVGVIWQDRSEDPKGKCQYLYFAASIDGGKTFTKPVKVSSELSCMERKENFWAAWRYKSGGDYTGFIAKPNGDFFVIWPDSRNGNSQLYAAEISVTND